MINDLLASVTSELLKASGIAALVAAAVSGLATWLGKRLLERKLESEKAANTERLDRLKAGYEHDWKRIVLACGSRRCILSVN